MGRILTASLLPQLLAYTTNNEQRLKQEKLIKSSFLKLQGLVGTGHSELAHANLPTKDPAHNPHASASPICISTAWRATTRGSSLGAISVSPLQGKSSVMYSAKHQAVSPRHQRV